MPIVPARSKAEALFASDACADVGRRVAVLLTDGRVDGEQARSAAERAARLADEQACTLYALGVGRSVDTAELMRIIAAGGCADTGALLRAMRCVTARQR